MSHHPPATSPPETPKVEPPAGMFVGVQREEVQRAGTKVTIVGAAGSVALASAFSLLNQGLCSELVLLDIPAAQTKLRGEAEDLKHGAAYMRHTRIRYGADYALSANSDLVIITAGARQNVGESRLSLVERNFKIMQSIVPAVTAASPNCCILVVSNPVDICTWIVSKLADLPPGRVFGSGTALDSSRFRTLLADRFGVDTRSVHAVVLGEHGDSSVAAWSAVILGNQLLRHVKPQAGLPGDLDNFEAIHVDVIQSAYRVIEAKGHTNWAIGLTVASLTEALLRNDHRILPLSVPVRGLYGIEQDVFLSLPAVLGRSGVRDIVPVTLDEHEQAKLRASAAAIYEVQATLKF